MLLTVETVKHFLNFREHFPQLCDSLVSYSYLGGPVNPWWINQDVESLFLFLRREL